MIIYNVTYKVDMLIHEQWLLWIKTVYIPQTMKTGMFIKNQVARLLSVDEEDGITYAVQFTCPDIASFRRFQEEYAYSIQKTMFMQFKDQFVAFTTLMELV